MFNTTRRIAQYELERLVEEGVLIGKKRIGTFTNSQSNYSRHVTVDAMPLIGVTFGSGDHFPAPMKEPSRWPPPISHWANSIACACPQNRPQPCIWTSFR